MFGIVEQTTTGTKYGGLSTAAAKCAASGRDDDGFAKFLYLEALVCHWQHRGSPG